MRIHMREPPKSIILLGGYYNTKYEYLGTALDPNPYYNSSFSGKSPFPSLIFLAGSNPKFYGFLFYLGAKHTVNTLLLLSFV
jgi:hypothetical protein